MAIEDVMLLSLVATVLVLPWTLKTAGLYDKVKKWYRILLSGFVFTLIFANLSLFTSAWEGLSFISNSITYQWTILGLEAIGVIIIFIGFLGIFKELLTK